VLFLDHRVNNQVGTRRLRIIKYRGSMHGTNEYPTMIDNSGLSVLPISSLSLEYGVTKQRISTGIADLDQMFGGKGYFRGSSILVSGNAGTGKSSLAAAFADAACRRGERCLYLSFEESPAQITRNMASIGFDLARWVAKNLLCFHAVRPTLYGLEQHLVELHRLVETFRPANVILDPITNLTSIGEKAEISMMLTRVIDFLKIQSITGLFTSLTEGGTALERTDTGISSLMDTWILLHDDAFETGRRRMLYILKSRGMAHSREVRHLVLSDRGIQVVAMEFPEQGSPS
jgi:circadian clock protein KaiC